MLVDRKTYIGIIQRNIYGNWSDCDRGLYIDNDRIEDILGKYECKQVKITIEVVEEEPD